MESRHFLTSHQVRGPRREDEEGPAWGGVALVLGLLFLVSIQICVSDKYSWLPVTAGLEGFHSLMVECRMWLSGKLKLG